MFTIFVGYSKFQISETPISGLSSSEPLLNRRTLTTCKTIMWQRHAKTLRVALALCFFVPLNGIHPTEGVLHGFTQPEWRDNGIYHHHYGCSLDLQVCDLPRLHGLPRVGLLLARCGGAEPWRGRVRLVIRSKSRLPSLQGGDLPESKGSNLSSLWSA